jgi:hypothetical protein
MIFRDAVALHDKGEFDVAISRYEDLLVAEPRHIGALFNYGAALLHLRRFGESLEVYNRLLSIIPTNVKALSNKGIVLHHLGRIDEEMAVYDLAMIFADDEEAIELHYNRSCVLLQRGDFKRGWREHEWRVPKSRKRQFDKPRWSGENLDGKTILLWAEQGFGDTIQFCRYANLFPSGANVVLQVPPALVDLMCTLKGDNIGIISHLEAVPYDYQCPIMSLPLMFGTTIETIPSEVPYLFADECKAASWANHIRHGKRKVGLVWGGNRHNDKPHVNWVAKLKSFDCDQYAPLLDVDGCEFFSLQKDEAPTVPGITNYTAEFCDFSNTAALIANLDLVISVDTSVAHLAGAMGKPVWIMTPCNACWRWLLDRTDSPWYPTARLFRQQSDNSWNKVILDVRDNLTMS